MDTGIPEPQAPPSVSLPKGGGAIRGLGEKFTANAATGTASLELPVPTSPGRSGFGPCPTLGYDSGAGNGPFGLGWAVSLPSITRKTDRGLPRYQDDPDQDTFVLSGVEDLVPVRRERDGSRVQEAEQRSSAGREYSVQRYRPRVEGAFTRIERWRDLGSGETHWRCVSAGNLTTVYGATAESRVADPAEPEHVFSWLISESFDDTGNRIVYRYAAEDDAGIDTTASHERARTTPSRSANRYPKRIRYGNRTPGGDDWMFEVVFDYGDHDARDPLPEPTRPWPRRPDPFSTYRPGFEVRTYRRCHRVLMFHHIPEQPEVGADCLVGSTDLEYTEARADGTTTIASIVHTGYRREPTGGYKCSSTPPVEFGYSRSVFGHEQRTLDPSTLATLPAGIDGTAAAQWVDLDGVGLPGILTRQGEGWFYRANRGGGRFAPPRALATRPASSGAGHRQEFLDLTGDGHIDLVDLDGPVPGFHERTDDGWRPFRAFGSLPRIAWNDRNLRLVDLDGDGLADVLVTGDDALTWYPSLGADGFGAGRRAAATWDEEHGPRVVFADPEESLYLADMSGDGLSDLVRVRNGEVCYWPNLGFGRFGARVVMDGAPWFDEPDHFDQRRVRLADVDGSGTTDVVYLRPDGVRLYPNLSGNAWGAPHALPVAFPRLDSASRATVTDLLGRGTACLVWSSPLPAESGRQLRYVDLMADGKPHLLTSVVNNLGAETRIEYAPSTSFCAADHEAGRPWATKLPFPVQVVARVETLDRVNRNRFSARYAYHHGYFDGIEREFRGFGMVERRDTEELAVLRGAAHQDIENLDPATDLPPALTRTWFHTGAEGLSRHFAAEYWREPGDGGPRLPEPALPDTLRTPTEHREAWRALKGAMLREEVYALDDGEAASRPYTVTEHTYAMDLLQHALDPRPDGPWNYHAVFLTHAAESVTAHYERVLYDVAGDRVADPRVNHTLVLATDYYGNPLRSADVTYGRRYPDPALTPADQREQARTRVMFTENEYTNAIDVPDAYRTPAPCESRVFEVLGLEQREHGLFPLRGLRDALAAIDTDLPYELWGVDPATLSAPARRLIERDRTLFRRDDLRGPLPFGTVESRALPYRSYRQSFTDSLLAELYDGRVDESLLTAAGYVRDGSVWWIPSGDTAYSPGIDDGPEAELDYALRHFFLPLRFRDQFGAVTRVAYDGNDLLPIETRDPVGNVTSATNDYRVLAPRQVEDPNGNRGAVAFDTLGRVAGTAVMGKATEQLGDTLDGFDADPDAASIAAYFADPFATAHELLGTATTRLVYDLDAYRREERPAAAAVLSRETHLHDLAPAEATRIQHAIGHSDGFGREVQRKIQAAPGPVEDGGPNVDPRWIGSGWTVFDNKGNPVRQYEPFFTATHRFEFARAVGVSSVIFYDPIGRAIATLHPDATYEKSVFDPWHQTTWDADDTALLDPREDPDVRGLMGRYLSTLADWRTWYAQRADGDLGEAEQRAAEKAAALADTPAQAWLDSLGRTYLAAVHNRVEDVDELYYTRTVSDIEGNVHEIRDALGRLVALQQYTMLSAQVSHAGMDAGGGALVPDVTGKPVLSWNARGFTFRTEYDALRRVTRTYVQGPGITGEALYQRTDYGETEPEAAARNLRTRAVRLRDSAALTTNPAFDFKGNLLTTEHQLAVGYHDVLDWSGDVPLDERVYRQSGSFDALNRPTSTTAPDGSVLIPSYDEGGKLARLEGEVRGEAPATTFVASLEYDAHGRRTLVEHGNQTRTCYRYDPLTFRLRALHTSRGGHRLQDLAYTYDPVGNVTHVHDAAQPTLFFRNKVVRPSASYTYDALYRLVKATGREHLGQAGPVPPSADDAMNVGLPQPGDGTAMARYTERYWYDPVGNLQTIAHRSADASAGGWTRLYEYAEPSLLEPDRHGNRLSGTTPASAPGHPVPIGYDAQGNITALPEIPVMHWDPEDRLHMTSRRKDGAEPVYYTYDAAGERVRKVSEGPDGQRRSERIYLGAVELYREYAHDGAVRLERETLHVLDDTSRVAMVETRTLGIDRGAARLTRYQHGDHLDSSVLELDEQARIISYEEYHPYGSTAYQSVRSTTETPKRYRYTGKERDTETGLSYHGARYYAPWLARWTSCDPAGLAGGPNLYEYVMSNPIRLVDPSGREGESKDPEQVAAEQIGKFTGMDPATFVLGLGQGPQSMVAVRDQMVQAGLMGKDGGPPPPPPPPYQGPSVSQSTPEQIEAADAQAVQDREEAYHKDHPTVRDDTMFAMGLLQHAVDPSNVGILKEPFAVAYMIAGNDVATAQRKGGELDAFVGLAAITPVGTGGSASGGAPEAALNERATMLAQRSAAKAAGETMPPSRTFTAGDAIRTMQRTGPVNPAEVAAAQKGVLTLRMGGTAGDAGTVVHNELGAAGSREGVDFLKPGSIEELKTVWTTGEQLDPQHVADVMAEIDRQTLEAQILLQRAAREAGLDPLVKLRIGRIQFVNPANGASVKVSF